MMSKKSTNPPVFYTIVQAQFNPIAAMVNYINEIQDKLRFDGYNYSINKRLLNFNLILLCQARRK